MSFLFPAFLWGLLAVLLPLAIHLFNFRRTKRVFFTNVSFLKEIETQKSAFRKLKQLLILAARMLALACLALAFAQPYLKNQESAATFDGVMSIYLDNSFSMQNEHNNKRLIDRATSSLDELFTIYPNLTSLQLLTNEFTAEDHLLLTAARLRDKLASVYLTPVSRTMEEVYARQKRLSDQSASGRQRELFWISDFQKSSVGDLSDLTLDSTDYLNVVPIQAAAHKNVYVDSVWLETPFVRQHQRNTLHVRIRNSGNELVESVPVRLFLEEAQVSATSVDVPASGSERITFDFNLSHEGYIKGMVDIEDFPVAFDNQFYFVLNASPALNILHVHASEQAILGGIGRVYRNDSLFRIDHMNIASVDIGKVPLADFVILNEVSQIPQLLASEVIEFVKRGGSLLVIPPKEIGKDYESFLLSIGVSGVKKVDGSAIPLNVPDANIPFFRDVFEASLKLDTEINMPSAINVWEWSKAGNTLLSLRNGQPFLSEIGSGRGKVYLLGAPLDPANGNFSQHALFVPVMYRMAALSSRAEPTSFTFKDRTIELKVDDALPNAVFKLRNGTNEIVPVQRLVGNRLLLELPEGGDLGGTAIEPGYFELLNSGKIEKLLALNLDNDESVLAFYTAEELKKFFAGTANVRVFDNIEDSDFNSKLERHASGAGLWKYFLYAALLFLLIEILIIRLMK